MSTPSHPGYLDYRLALKDMKQGRTKDAVATAARLFKAHPNWAASHRLLGLLNLKTGKLHPAEMAFRKALSLDPEDLEARCQLICLLKQTRPDEALSLCDPALHSKSPLLCGLTGELLLAAGRRAEALAVYEQRWSLKPEAAWVLRLAEYLAATSPVQARSWLERVISLEPTQPQALGQLAELAFADGNYVEARSIWHRLVGQVPNARTWNRLATVEWLLGQTAQARHGFARAKALKPEGFDMMGQLIPLLLDKDAESEAVHRIREILAYATAQDEACPDLSPVADTLLRTRRYHLADQFLELCCEFPKIISWAPHEIYVARASCRHHLLEHEGMAQMYARAHETAPHPLQHRYEELSSLPYIYASLTDLEEARRNFEQNVDRLSHQVEARLQQKELLTRLLGGVPPPFLLAYHGHNDRPIMEKLAGIWSRVLQGNSRVLKSTHEPATGGRIRVGFISNHFCRHSVTFCYFDRIESLAKNSDIEVTCIHLGQRLDKYSTKLRESVQRFIQVSADKASKAVLDLKLDVLIYTDIGMDPHTYQLAQLRLAPIQGAFAGHPVTTGLPHMDYYFSNRFSEPANGQEHYTETMLPLMLGHTQKPRVLDLPDQFPDRGNLGLSDSERIYFCPMTLFKVHPEFDGILASILRQDPEGIVYLARYKDMPYHKALQRRFERFIPDVASRIRFLPWLSQPDFFGLLSHADALLDTTHFGGGTTTRMILNLDRPYVSLPGRFLRGRMTFGAYREIGVTDAIADSPEDYATRALRLAQDKAYRQDVCERIATARLETEHPQNELYDLGDIIRQIVAAYPKRLHIEHPTQADTQGPVLGT